MFEMNRVNRSSMKPYLHPREKESETTCIQNGFRSPPLGCMPLAGRALSNSFMERYSTLLNSSPKWGLTSSSASERSTGNSPKVQRSPLKYSNGADASGHGTLHSGLPRKSSASTRESRGSNSPHSSLTTSNSSERAASKLLNSLELEKLPTNISKAVAAIRRGRKTTLQELQTMLGRLKHMDPPILVTAFRPSYKYSYVFGSRYPGTLFGHRDCAPRSRRVPGLKGWAWDTRAPLQRSTKLTPLPDGTLPEGTWRPGAICNSLRDRVKAPKRAMRPFGQAMRPRRLSNEHLPLNEEGKSGKTDNDDDNYDPKPTLHIHRYQGDFFVSMHPDDMAGENVPLQFRIINKEKKPITCQDSDSELEIELFQPGAFYTVPKPDLCDEKTQCEEQYLVENYVPPPKIITATEIPKPIDANGKAKGKGKEKKAKKGKKGKKKK